MPQADDRSVTTEILERAVQGRHLRAGPLAAQLGPEPMLLVFLRHFG